MLLAWIPLVLIPITQSQWSPELIQKTALGPADAESITKYFGGDERVKLGADPKVSDLTVAWAIRVAPTAKTVLVRSESTFKPALQFLFPGQSPKSFEMTLKRVGNDGLCAGAATLVDGDGFRWRYVVDGQPVGDRRELEVYAPDPKWVNGVPAGNLTAQPKMQSQVFGGTSHDWWIYTPANFDPRKESNLVVFQDGQWSHNYVPSYFDQLAAKGEFVQTVVVFVSPGTFANGDSDRSREYDTLSDAYSKFLLDELLPSVESKYKITQDPKRRCLSGLSSGGICAFTVAWQRPDKFGLVLSWIGSFANIASGESRQAGGHNYPALIRKTPAKPIRVFLQDGANDLDNVHGSWPLGNLEMATALDFAKYDYRAVWGSGFHSDKHGRATLMDALRWLYREER